MDNIEMTQTATEIKMSDTAAEKIQTYLNNMFISFPPTEETMRVKNDLYCSMLDKYNGLVQNGAGEDAAFGRVVSEFGSLNEIRAALGINEVSAEAVPSVLPERRKQYNAFKIRQGIAVVCGVIFCIGAVFGYPVYGAMVGEPVSNYLFGVLVALGVFLFVLAGTGEAKFYDVTDPKMWRTGVAPERMAQYRRFLGIRQVLISLAVALFVVSPFVYDVLTVYLTMPLLVSVGVAILIVVGAVHGTYNDVRVDK